MKKNKKSGLLIIPSVGKATVRDLNRLGIFKVEDLKNKNPEKLYEELSGFYASKLDRCVLYVFRCAVYFAKETNHDPTKLKWWNWKD
ncbi:MAG: pathogenicity locus [Spirochaetes bacterium]|nr:pathogenicity locus [Spirochaetota bacterium]